jgi:hypothetical protein
MDAISPTHILIYRLVYIPAHAAVFPCLHLESSTQLIGFPAPTAAAALSGSSLLPRWNAPQLRFPQQQPHTAHAMLLVNQIDFLGHHMNPFVTH